MKNLLVRKHTRASLVNVPCFALCIATFLLLSVPSSSAQVAPYLGQAQKFAVLGGSTVTNTGPTLVSGDLGVSPGSALTGFPPGTETRGSLHLGDTMAASAQTDEANASTQLSSEACQTTYSPATDIGGMTLPPGVYCFPSSAAVTGSVILDANGDPNAIWVFNIGSTLTTASSSTVQLANSAQHANVYWNVGSSAVLGTNSQFQGSILALASITLNSGASLAGRALAHTGAVTLDDNTASICVCTQPYTAIASTVVKTIKIAPTVNGVPGTVFGTSLSPDGKSIWVAGSNGTSTPGFISLIDVDSLAVTQSVNVGIGPADIAFSAPGGRAFVTNYNDSSVSVITVPTLKVTHTLNLAGILSNPSGVLSAFGHLFLTSPNVASQPSGYSTLALNTTTPISVAGAVPIAGQTGRPARVPSTAPQLGGFALVPEFVGVAGTGHPTLVVVSTVHATVIRSLSLYSSHAVPEAVVVSPDGAYAYVSLFDTTGGSGGVWVVSLATMRTKTVILTCDPQNYGEAISSDGKYLLVAGFSQRQIALIDTATDTVDTIIKGGSGPNAIALSSDDSEAFVTNQADGTVTVVSFTPSL